MNFWFPVDNRHRWLGEIDIAGFIPQAQTSLTPGHGPGPRLFLGDNRLWTEPGNFIEPDRNRFFARLDFSTGSGYVQVNPTCRLGGTCSSAWPLVYGVYAGNDERMHYNYAAVLRSGDTYRFKWSVAHADRGVGQDFFRPRADGKIDFTAVNGGSSFDATWSGDCFPSVEVMRVSGGTTEVIGRVGDAGAWSMIGLYSKAVHFLGGC